MRDYVIINGVNSLTINGLAISKLPPISKPLMRNMKEEIDGRDGDIITELGYSAYDKEMEIGLYGNFDINEVISFFNGEGTIVFSNENDKHYYFKILEQIDYEKLLKFKTATVTFHCQPFKYPNNEEIIEADSVTVEGTGTSMSLSNTALYESIKMDLLGDTFQNGTPSPSSPIAVETVTGRQEIKVCSKNIYNGVSTNKGANSAGVISVQNSHYLGFDNMVAVSPNTTYTVTFFDYELDTTTIAEYKKDGTFIVRRSLSLNRTFTTGADTYYVFCWMFNSNIDYTTGTRIQLELGSQSTSFEEFNGNIYEINLGKNLFNISSTRTNESCTSSVSNNILTQTNTGTYCRTLWKFENMVANNHYTFSCNFENTNNCSLQVRIYNSDLSQQIAATTTATNSLGNFVLTFTTTESTFNIRIYSNTTNTSNNYSVSFSNLQLERGNQSTSYIPYKTPIELCKIGDYKDFIRKGTGKNLLQLTDGTYSNNGITAVVNNGIIVLNGTASANSFITIPSNIDSIYSSLSGSYTLCSNNEQTVGSTTTSGTYADVRIMGNNGVSFIWRNILGNQNASQTSTTSAYTNISLQIRTGSGLSYSNFVIELQLEKGNQATLFEAYGFKDKWYLYKTIGKTTYVGTESWEMNTSGGYKRAFISIEDSLDLGQSRSSDVYCTHFKNSTTNDIGIIFRSGKQIYCYVQDGITTAAEFKTWLASNNMNVYYRLAAPTATEITDQELLEQLNLLSNATGYEGTTNISSSGYLPTILNVSAKAIPTTTITNIGNIYAKPLLTIRGSGDISIYLNGIQLLQIALGDREEITIDISKMEAYDEETKVLLNRLVIGDYSKFLINSGNNELIITGDVSNFSMSGYTRWL